MSVVGRVIHRADSYRNVRRFGCCAVLKGPRCCQPVTHVAVTVYTTRKGVRGSRRVGMCRKHATDWARRYKLSGVTT